MSLYKESKENKKYNKPSIIVVKPVNCDEVRIRKYASLNAEVLKTIKKDTSFKVYAQEATSPKKSDTEGFYKLAGEPGYVSKDFVEVE